MIDQIHMMIPRLLIATFAVGPHAVEAYATRLSKGIVSGLTAAINIASPKSDGGDFEKIERRQARVLPAELLEGLRRDFEEAQYLWSGKITDELYDERCSFSDPTLSFEGLGTFKRNIANLDPLLERFVPPPNRRVLLKSLALDEGRSEVVAQWRMEGGLAVLPWRPRIDLDGQTVFTFDTQGVFKASWCLEKVWDAQSRRAGRAHDDFK